MVASPKSTYLITKSITVFLSWGFAKLALTTWMRVWGLYALNGLNFCKLSQLLRHWIFQKFCQCGISYRCHPILDHDGVGWVNT